MNIRRNVLIVICILSASMILSSCDKGGNHTESELGGSNMSDVNDVVVNEEDKPVEPKDLTVFSQEVNGLPDYNKTFGAMVSNGKYVNIAVKSYNDAVLNCILYANGKMYSRTTIKAGEGVTFKYTMTNNTNFEISLGVVSGGGKKGHMSVYIKARQYS